MPLLLEARQGPALNLPEGERHEHRFGPDPETGDLAFLRLLHAYRPSGGLVRLDALGHEMVARRVGDAVSVMVMIALNEAFGFEWARSVWLPRFQFDSTTLQPCSTVQSALTELSGVLDGWETAHWFAAPNVWLNGLPPQACMTGEREALLCAARATRFSVSGPTPPDTVEAV